MAAGRRAAVASADYARYTTMDDPGERAKTLLRQKLFNNLATFSAKYPHIRVEWAEMSKEFSRIANSAFVAKYSVMSAEGMILAIAKRLHCNQSKLPAGVAGSRAAPSPARGGGADSSSRVRLRSPETPWRTPGPHAQLRASLPHVGDGEAPAPLSIEVRAQFPKSANNNRDLPADGRSLFVRADVSSHPGGVPRGGSNMIYEDPMRCGDAAWSCVASACCLLFCLWFTLAEVSSASTSPVCGISTLASCLLLVVVCLVLTPTGRPATASFFGLCFPPPSHVATEGKGRRMPLVLSKNDAVRRLLSYVGVLSVVGACVLSLLSTPSTVPVTTVEKEGARSVDDCVIVSGPTRTNITGSCACQDGHSLLSSTPRTVDAKSIRHQNTIRDGRNVDDCRLRCACSESVSCECFKKEGDVPAYGAVDCLFSLPPWCAGFSSPWRIGEARVPGPSCKKSGSRLLFSTANVTSLRTRIPSLHALVGDCDVLAVQETSLTASSASLARQLAREEGWNNLFHGPFPSPKVRVAPAGGVEYRDTGLTGSGGVGFLVRGRPAVPILPPTSADRPRFWDVLVDSRRWCGIAVPLPARSTLFVHNVYLPTRARQDASCRHEAEELARATFIAASLHGAAPVIVCGDMNMAPEDSEVFATACQSGKWHDVVEAFAHVPSGDGKVHGPSPTHFPTGVSWVTGGSIGFSPTLLLCELFLMRGPSPSVLRAATFRFVFSLTSMPRARRGGSGNALRRFWCPPPLRSLLKI